MSKTATVTYACSYLLIMYPLTNKSSLPKCSKVSKMMTFKCFYKPRGPQNYQLSFRIDFVLLI